MTAAFWWYLLAGFIIGFCLSTVWEWLYFRQRRMRIADRRIAALQQQLDSQMRAARPDIPSEPGVTWTATEYQSPGILLENETDAQPAPRAAVPVTAAVLHADQANGRGALAVDPAPPWVRATAMKSADDAPSAAEAVAAAALLTHAGTAEEPTAEPNAAQPPDGEHRGAEAVAAAALLSHAGAAEEPTAEPNAAQPLDAEHRGAEAAAAAALVTHAGTAEEPTAEPNAAQPPDAEHRGAEAAAAAALLSHAGAADEPTAAQNAAQPPDGEHRGAEAAAAAALLAHAGTADEPIGEQTETAPAPTTAPPPPAESAPGMAPSNAVATAVTTEVRGFSARQGYIVSELSPGEFTALKATQKARQAARRAWEQARAVTDYLRNV